MAALDGAVTLKEVNNVALAISQNLHLDVLWLDYRGLEVDAAIAESGFRFAGGLGSLLAQLIFGFYEAHSAPATTGNGLNEYGEIEILGVFHQLIDVRRWLRILQRRQPSFLRRAYRCSLITSQIQCGWGRANELNSIVLTGTSEIRALRKKTVAGVNSIRFRLLRGANNFIDIEISLYRLPLGTNTDGFICKGTMEGVTVFTRVDRDGLCPSFKGSAECTHGDFAAVGYQNLFERWKRGISHFGVPFNSEGTAIQHLLLGDPYLSLEIETFLVCPFSSGFCHTIQRLNR